MSDLVVNPKDRFSHEAAQSNAITFQIFLSLGGGTYFYFEVHVFSFFVKLNLFTLKLPCQGVQRRMVLVVSILVFL